MARTTQAQLDGMLRRAAAAARKVGLDTDGWELRRGTKNQGITYTLATGHGRGSHVDLGGWGGEHLGWTCGEAYVTLQRLAQAWEAVEAVGAKL